MDKIISIDRVPVTFEDIPIYPYVAPYTDDCFILKEDWSYIWQEANQYWRIQCKSGIVYDGASVPNILGAIFDIHPNGILMPAALPHDLLYIFQGKNFPSGMVQYWNGSQWINDDREFTRKQSDKIFKRILKEANIASKFKIWASYRAVRLGGLRGWLSKDLKDRKRIARLYP